MFHGNDVFKSSFERTDPAFFDDQVLVGSWFCDLATETLTWSDGVFDLFGLDRGRAIDRRDTLGFYSEKSREILTRRRQTAIRTGQAFSCVAQLHGADGVDRWMQINAVPFVQAGRAIALSGTKRDVTRERSAWEALRRLAHNDPLTGLANRAAFHANFLDLPTGSARLGDLGALVLFDLDGFKSLNDGWGHPAGDACLAAFARRLLMRFPKAHMIARIGGDEFALLLDRVDAQAVHSGALPALVASLAAPFGWRDTMLSFGASAGVALTKGLGPIDPDALFAYADANLYLAKANRGQNPRLRQAAT